MQGVVVFLFLEERSANCCLDIVLVIVRGTNGVSMPVISDDRAPYELCDVERPAAVQPDLFVVNASAALWRVGTTRSSSMSNVLLQGKKSEC